MILTVFCSEEQVLLLLNKNKQTVKKRLKSSV